MAVVCAFLKDKGNLPQISCTAKINIRSMNVQYKASETILNYEILKYFSSQYSKNEVLTSPNNSPESRVAKANTVYDPQTGNPRSSIK